MLQTTCGYFDLVTSHMSVEIKWGRKMESVGDNLWSHGHEAVGTA